MKVFRYLRERSSNLMSWLVKHHNVVVATCVTSILFMALIFWMQLGHTADALKLIETNIELESNIEDYRELVDAQNLYIKKSNEIMSDQRAGIIKAGSLIGVQQVLIKQLIEELKKLGGWPDEPRYDPDKWTTRSEAI